jgi:hypothetical protein
MVSATQQTDRRRRIRQKKAGRAARAENRRNGTPAFPVHQEGYDPKAADAKPADKAST